MRRVGRLVGVDQQFVPHGHAHATVARRDVFHFLQPLQVPLDLAVAPSARGAQLAAAKKGKRRIEQVRYSWQELYEETGVDTFQVGIRMADYGMHLGTAFQLVDDVLDYSGQEADTGKHLGDDLAEGKPTLPLIYVMQHGTAEQAACVRKAIEEGGRDDFPLVLEAIRSSGALDHARKRAVQEAELARASIQCLGDSQYKEALLQLSFFAVERNH